MRAFMQAFNTQRLLAQMLLYSFLFFVRHPGKLVFIFSSTLEPVAYPMHDGRCEEVYETYEREVSQGIPHKFSVLPDSRGRSDARCGNRGSRDS